MAYKSTGTLLRIGANSIAELTSISDVGPTGSTIETTNLASTSKSFIGAGVIDGGEISCSGLFNPNDTNGQKAMYDLVASQTVTAFSVLWASISADFSFNGIVTEFKIGAEVEAGIAFDAKIRVTGLPTLGVTASTGLSALSMSGTGGTLAPSFGAAVRYYAFTGVTAASVTVTATAASHTIELFVDGVWTQTLTSGSASSAITMSIGTKMLTIVAYEAGKAQQVTQIVAQKAS